MKGRAAEKLGYTADTRDPSSLRVVFEDDGTEVEDEAYFQSAARETVFLLLRHSETWQPAAMDALKSGKLSSQSYYHKS